MVLVDCLPWQSAWLSCSSRDRLTGDSFSAEVLLCVSRRLQAGLVLETARVVKPNMQPASGF